MEIQSRLLGNQIINPETIITFPCGIPGFENQTRFKLFHREGSEIIFWLQSIDDADLTFSVAHPTHFYINYNFTLTDDEQKLLDVQNHNELIVLIILHQEDDATTGKPTIKGSIKSPLLINSEKRLGYQKVMSIIEQSITLTEKTNAINLIEA